MTAPMPPDPFEELMRRQRAAVSSTAASSDPMEELMRRQQLQAPDTVGPYSGRRGSTRTRTLGEKIRGTAARVVDAATFGQAPRIAGLIAGAGRVWSGRPETARAEYDRIRDAGVDNLESFRRDEPGLDRTGTVGGAALSMVGAGLPSTIGTATAGARAARGGGVGFLAGGLSNMGSEDKSLPQMGVDFLAGGIPGAVLGAGLTRLTDRFAKAPTHGSPAVDNTVRELGARMNAAGTVSSRLPQIDGPPGSRAWRGMRTMVDDIKMTGADASESVAALDALHPSVRRLTPAIAVMDESAASRWRSEVLSLNPAEAPKMASRINRIDRLRRSIGDEKEALVVTRRPSGYDTSPVIRDQGIRDAVARAAGGVPGFRKAVERAQEIVALAGRPAEFLDDGPLTLELLDHIQRVARSEAETLFGNGGGAIAKEVLRAYRPIVEQLKALPSIRGRPNVGARFGDIQDRYMQASQVLEDVVSRTGAVLKESGRGRGTYNIPVTLAAKPNIQQPTARAAADVMVPTPGGMGVTRQGGLSAAIGGVRAVVPKIRAGTVKAVGENMMMTGNQARTLMEELHRRTRLFTPGPSRIPRVAGTLGGQLGGFPWLSPPPEEQP